jgi:hypothetical protein
LVTLSKWNVGETKKYEEIVVGGTYGIYSAHLYLGMSLQQA